MNQISNKDIPLNKEVSLTPQPSPTGYYPKAKNGDVLLGNPNYFAISYGAWRCQIRESGENVPTVEEQKEDMKILFAMGFKVLRTYNTQNYIGNDGKSNTENLLEAIRQLNEEAQATGESFEMYVMLGIWIDGLNSFTDKEVIHDQENPKNALEMAMGIKLAKEYSEIIKVIAVGNEAMVHWAPYYVVPGIILKHVNTLQALKEQGELAKDLWITSSDNHASWGSEGEGGDYINEDLKALIATVDYISVHIYPFHDTFYHDTFWSVPSEEAHFSIQQKVDLAMQRSKVEALTQTLATQQYMLGLGIEKQIHIGETGWASVANVNYGDDSEGDDLQSRAADEYKQKAYYEAMQAWSKEFGASMFFFQAFDEPWKGDTYNPGDSEKHFGLIDIEGNAKYVVWDKVNKLNSLGLTRGSVATFTKSFDGNVEGLMKTVSAPKAR
ncbi:glycosyl hydrolase family 17 protein [Psychromonas sp. KJ10-10]|uniref:glycosyl hydrolase family 17 protein n=1 Tax=Psychromonas sp. KJ10-10 TaxID=3391823 RepID=UPI0039B46D1E